MERMIKSFQQVYDQWFNINIMTNLIIKKFNIVNIIIDIE